MKVAEIRQQAILSENVAVGDRVAVYTRMGNFVCEGIAAYPMANGLSIGSTFYAADLYLFVAPSVSIGEAHTCAGDLPLDVDRRMAQAAVPLDEARKIGNNKAAKVGKAHPDNLPSDVKRAIITTTDLTDEQMNRVIAAVGDTALKALKGIGVRDDEVFGRVQRVNDAVKHALRATKEDLKDQEDEADGND